MKSLWYPCMFAEDMDINGQCWHNAVITETTIQRLGLNIADNDPTLIVAIKFNSLRNNDSILITLARKSVLPLESGTCATLYTSKKFINNNPMLQFSNTYLMKVVNPCPLEKIILGTSNQEEYESARSDKWTVDLMLRVCEEKVLCRQGDDFPSLNPSTRTKSDNPAQPNLIILQCQPVLQGIVTVQTQIIIVKLEEKSLPGFSFDRNSQKPSLDDASNYNLLDYWKLVQFCACFVLPYTLGKNRSPNPVLSIIASAYRILYQRIQPTFNIQILPVSPFKNVDCGVIDPMNVIFLHPNTAKKLHIKNFTWVQVNLTNKFNGHNEQFDGESEKIPCKLRWVQVYYISDENLQVEIFGEYNENLAYLNPTLWFNLNDHPSPLVQPHTRLCIKMLSDDIKSVEPPKASEVTVAVIQSPLYEGIKSFDGLLHKYFSSNRYLQSGDILCVGSTDDPEVETSASGVWKLKKGMVFFRVTKIVGSTADSIGYFASKQVTSLYQISTAFSYIPTTMDVYSYLEIGRSIWNNPLPPGLVNYVHHLQGIITPYLNFKSLSKQILPSILLSGTRGCGKLTVVKAAARMTNIHLYQVNCYDLLAETSGSTEGKLKQTLIMASKSVPCLLVMKNVHVLGRSKDGSHEDCRVTQVFHDTATTFTQDIDSFPIILIGITTDEELLTADYASIFLHKISIQPPADVDRQDMLGALLVNSPVGIDVSISQLADETKGFVLGDLCTLISNASLAAHKRLTKLGHSTHLSPNDNEDILLAGIFLSKSDFTEALNVLQAAYSDAIGAPKVPNVEWEDVGGLEDVKRAILDTVQLPLQHPELISAGLKRSGILLFGPPGTGKTLLAKAVATECHLHFLSVKGPELLNMYVGQSEENVREVFKRARSAAPCVVFFDELDSLAPNRGRSGDSGGVMDRVVSQLLAELDGLDKSATVYVIGATNRPDLIDPALLRPGRFDKLLFVGVTETPESKLKILKALTRKFSLSEDVVLETIASICPPTATGADLYALCSDAVMNAISKRVHQLADGATEDFPLVITNEDLKSAAQHLIPSVSSFELQRYQQIKVTAMGKN